MIIPIEIFVKGYYEQPGYCSLGEVIQIPESEAERQLQNAEEV